MRKWNNQCHEHGTNKKIWFPTGFERWPPKHRAGALSTELPRTNGECTRFMWHASCILLGSAMSRSYCMVKEWKMVWRVLNMILVYGFSLHEFPVAQWIERPPGVWEVISSNRVDDSVFFFAPLSCHAVYLIIIFVSPSLKFAIFHSFTNIEISIYW